MGVEDGLSRSLIVRRRLSRHHQVDLRDCRVLVVRRRVCNGSAPFGNKWNRVIGQKIENGGGKARLVLAHLHDLVCSK